MSSNTFIFDHFKYRKLSRYDECEPLYARALTITEATYGVDHPEVYSTSFIIFIIVILNSDL